MIFSLFFLFREFEGAREPALPYGAVLLIEVFLLWSYHPFRSLFF